MLNEWYQAIPRMELFTLTVEDVFNKALHRAESNTTKLMKVLIAHTAQEDTIAMVPKCWSDTLYVKINEDLKNSGRSIYAFKKHGVNLSLLCL